MIYRGLLRDELIVGIGDEIALISVDGGLMSLNVDGFCKFPLFEVIKVVGQDSGVVPVDMMIGVGFEVIRDG